jgi:hypothetical protein
LRCLCVQPANRITIELKKVFIPEGLIKKEFSATFAKNAKFVFQHKLTALITDTASAASISKFFGYYAKEYRNDRAHSFLMFAPSHRYSS